MTAPLVFLDTETTGLSLDDDIWEFAAIRREPDGTETELHLFIEHDWEKCQKLPESFRDDHVARFPGHDQATSRRDAAFAIADILRSENYGKPHVIGAVPNFDTERIDRLLESQDARWKADWHYHLIDVENLTVGYLRGLGTAGLDYAPPWNSEELSRAVGVEPGGFERHTAMGDARWAMAIYGAVMGGT
jgi:hypothetical protein